MKDEWPHCKKCNKRLSLSKMEEDKWICKGCNEVYFSEDVLESNEKLIHGEKRIVYM